MHLADQADARAAVVEAIELVVDPAARSSSAVELAVALAAKQPHAVRPSCPRSSAWRAGTRPAPGTGCRASGTPISITTRNTPADGEPTSKHAHVGVCPEQRERAVHHHHVPLDRHAHRHVAGDEAVQQRASGRCPTISGHAAVREQQHDRNAELERRAGVAHRRRPAATAAGRPGSCGTSACAARRSAMNGLLLVITHTTAGKWWLSLENARPEPERELHRLGAGDPVAGEREARPMVVQ